MRSTRAPIFLALGLAFALAGAAQATTVSVHYNGPGQAVVSNGYYVGPYSLSVNPNPVTGGLVQFDALPCISADLHVGPPNDWKAEAYSGTDFASAVNVPLTGTTAVTLNQEQVWKAYYLGSKFGTWTNGSIQPANKDAWAAIHSAIWDATDPGSSPFEITTGSPTTASLLQEAKSVYDTRDSAQLQADLANFWVLLPTAADTATGLTPQPFLVAKGNWEEHNDSVPEPSTWALLLMGVAMTAMTCLKRRQTA